MPFGIVLTSDARLLHLDFTTLPDAPIRAQLRDATLAVFIDRGGTVRSAQSAGAYMHAARWLCKQLVTTKAASLDVTTLAVDVVHTALFSDLTTPVPLRIVLARRLLLNSALTRGNAPLARYLENLTLFGYARPSKGYTSRELECVLAWCKEELNSFSTERTIALRLIGANPDASDDEILAAAQSVLAESDHPHERRNDSALKGTVFNWPAAPANRRWWIAHLYVHGFELEPTWFTHQQYHRVAAMNALFPTYDHALAASLLVINEYGAEGQVLASLDVSDVERMPGNSSVVRITGVKARADRAVSRRGNAVASWSGGRVLERWIAWTAPARRWTGTEHLWLWRSLKSPSESPKNVRAPIQTHSPNRSFIQEGTKGIKGPEGATLKLSIRRMRKSWTERAERALGPGIAGPLDPNHSRLTAWAFYRGAALSLDERRAVIAQAQDDLVGMVRASQLVIDADLERDDLVALLIGNGVDALVAQRIVRGDADDSGTTTCRDARKAPGQAVGTLCRQTPFACLLCPNAIHTRLHLPVIMALSESIETERRHTPAEEFVQRWGGVDVGVMHVLSRFSAGSKEEAARDMAAARARLDRLKEVYS